MAIPDLVGFLVGEKVRAAKLNEHTKGAIEAAVHYKPFVHIANLNTFNAGVGNLAVPMDDLIDDTDSMTVGQTGGRVIVRTAGLYRVTAQVTYANASGGHRGINLYRNSSGPWVAPKVPATPANVTTVQWTCTARFSVNETLSVNSETSVACNNCPTGGPDGLAGSFLMMEWVSK
ncbi:hypothetical protein O7635_29555 [Asanoa sp. WMMD1127]|uniref:hypothetical protein n=1 Tax=Asanoa sp. WMMD1127 TaxID=3016107 RepID=UPI002415CA79|nr:hypothetical protein [Asanoa sp. WMMD1127]MDG4826016.1 hypothetical protein [Asanoa sp. WMMD1127]